MDVIEIVEFLQLIKVALSGVGFWVTMAVQCFIMVIVYAFLHKKQKTKIRKLEDEAKRLKANVKELEEQKKIVQYEKLNIENKAKAKFALMLMDGYKEKD